MRKLCFLPVLILFLFSAGCSKQSDSETLRVMTLNLRYDNPRDSINAWPNRAEFVSDFLNGEKPDLLGMQEVLVNQYGYLDSALTGYSSIGVGRSDGAKGGEMNPVFFRNDRFELIRTKTFWLS